MKISIIDTFLFKIESSEKVSKYGKLWKSNFPRVENMKYNKKFKLYKKNK